MPPASNQKKDKKKKKVEPEKAAKEKAAKEEEERRMALVREANRLQLECEREKRDHDQFLMEREKINYFWLVDRKKLTELEADLRNKTREGQDLEERQQIELKMFQQQLKHLRYSQLDEVVELKTDAELALKLQEDHHRNAEAELRKDKRALKVEIKEAEVAQADFISMLKMEQDQNLMEVRQEYDRKSRDIQQKHEQTMKTIRDDFERQRRGQVQKIEEARDAQIRDVKAKNQKDFLEMKFYFGNIKDSNLDLIKRLKDELLEVKEGESEDAKKMADLVRRNNQLKEPIKSAHQDVERLEAELAAYEEDKKKLAAVKAKIKQHETQKQRMEFQHEVLQQQLAIANAEREELYSKFQCAIYDVQQKAGLDNLLLEKKIDTAEEVLETTDAQVDELMASAAVGQAAAAGMSRRLDHAIAYRDGIAAELQEEAEHIRDMHRVMISTYESKLEEHGVPSGELGFTPTIS